MTTLVDDEWHGPVSASPAAAAAARYTRWLRTTAAWADRNARQADAAVAAYETAFAATVPPSVVAANRSQLTLLVATNFLGQNSPAIMATQLQYIEMWAQDAQAMTSYALASMAAAQLTSPSPPPQAVKGTDDRDAGANGLKDDGPPDWWTDFMNNWGPNSNTMNSLATIVAGFMVPTTWTGLVAGGEVAAAAADGAEVIGDGAVA
ncbi:PPE family protein, partial [Mycobacterium montefiorense]